MENISMLDFAHHIISIANKNNKTITDLQLQKVMYFSFKYMLKQGCVPEELRESYKDDPFLVWRYGPVVKSVYDEYKVYGAMPILEDDCVINSIDENTNQEILSLLNEDVYKLVNKSHEERFWQININNNYSKAYGLEDVTK